MPVSQNPLSPLANRALKGVAGGQVQKLIDAQVERVIGPLLRRVAELERRVADLEGGAAPPPRHQPDRSRDV